MPAVPGRSVGEPRRPIYLDHAATTPVDPRVAEAMAPYLHVEFGNPASRTHAYGWAAEEAVERARGHVAALLGASPREVVFTSGATESDNLAIKGVALREGRPGHLVTTAIEHKAVLDTCAFLEGLGWRVTRVAPGRDGVVSAADVALALGPETRLVSVMAVNNEVGTIQPLGDIGRACAAAGVLLHTDAAQAAGRIPLDVRSLGVHLASLSAHKMYGPKGVGALYVRQRDPKVRLQALIHGGGQERGMRSGTLNVSGIVGFGEAARIAAAERDVEARRLAGLSDRLVAAIRQAAPGCSFNGDLARTAPGAVNVAFPGVDAEALMIALKDDLAVSSGSACMSATLEPSYVLRAMGVPEDVANSAIRLTLGRGTTAAEVDRAARRLAEAATTLKDTAPSWKLSAWERALGTTP